MKEQPIFVCARRISKFGNEKGMTAFVTLPVKARDLFHIGDLVKIQVYNTPKKIVIEAIG